MNANSFPKPKSHQWFPDGHKWMCEKCDKRVDRALVTPSVMNSHCFTTKDGGKTGIGTNPVH